jgi:VanZ family protein
MEDVRRLVRFLPALAYMGLVFWMSSQVIRIPVELPGWLTWDKLLHAMEYGLLGFLLMLGVRPLCKRTGTAVAIVVALGLAWGVSDEFHQSFVKGRNGNDPGDMAADLVGSTLGALSYLAAFGVLQHIRRRKEPSVA